MLMGRGLWDVMFTDLTRYIAGPCCTKLPADYGIQAIKSMDWCAVPFKEMLKQADILVEEIIE